MSKNIFQVYTTNPITSNITTDLMYFGRAPYSTSDDAAMTFADFAAQFGNPFTPAALTKTDDSNVTLTLGGTPATALLQAVSLTLGWTGQLSVARGGTAASSFTPFSVVCGGITSGGALQSVVGLGTAGQQLTSNGPGALPTWQAGTVITPAAMTKTDDTNVTLTLGGSPLTSLLAATSLTLGWTGLLSPARGGTGVNNGTNTLTLGGNLTTSGAFNSTFTMTAATNVTFPNSGTLATTSQIPSVTPSALTKTDDTNVTLTLGGTPLTALLQATSLTLGWTGQLAITRGGTGISSFGTGVQTALGQNVSGSGGMALTTSPTFVTPILGVAAATSLTFGGTAMNTFEIGTFNPTITATTPGNLAVTYGTRGGQYLRINNQVFISAICVATNMTYTSASGAMRLGGLPFAAVSPSDTCFWSCSTGGNTYAEPSNTISYGGLPAAGLSTISVIRSSSVGGAVSAIQITSYPSANGCNICMEGYYYV